MWRGFGADLYLHDIELEYVTCKIRNLEQTEALLEMI